MDNRMPLPAQSSPVAAVPGDDVPTATYRLQLTKDLPLPQAQALVPYLSALGVSHLYASPLLAARPGSQHPVMARRGVHRR